MKGPFPFLGFQMELAYHRERPEVVQRVVDDLGVAGYNLCQLNLEDAYFFPSHPGLASAHTYDAEFMRDLAGRCAAGGMEFVPVIPSLGHCAYITRKPGYEQLDEGRGTDRFHGTLSPSFPETYDLLADLYADWCRAIPGRYLHVGLDESPAVGLYEQRTAGAAARPALEIFAAHCNRLNALVKRHGRRMIMWGDMFLHYPRAMELVDHDIIIAEWQYFLFPRAPLIECHDNLETDTAGRLRRAGFEVWGVPSVWPCSPVADIEERWTNVRDWVRYGRETGIGALVVSDWGNGLELFCLSHLVMRVIARSIETAATDAAPAVVSVLNEWLNGDPAVPALARDLLGLGRFQTRVFMDDKRYKQPLAGFVADAPERRAEFRDKAVALERLFAELSAALDRVRGHGRELLEALRLAHEAQRLYWTLGAELPELAGQLMSGDPAADGVSRRFGELAGAFETWVTAYRRLHDTVRYPDEETSAFLWARGVAATLRDWAGQAAAGAGPRHNLVMTARLDIRWRCDHVPMGNYEAICRWADGGEEKFSEPMYGCEPVLPAPLHRFSTDVLIRRTPPAEIEITTDSYGRAVIEAVVVSVGGTRQCYAPDRMAGPHVTSRPDGVEIGPICMDPNLPPLRSDRDQVWYRCAAG